MLRTRIVALPCWLFEFSPLNGFYRGMLVRSITLIRVPTSFGNHGKHGKSLKKVSCIEKS